LFWKHHANEIYATTRIMHHNNEHPLSPKLTTHWSLQNIQSNLLSSLRALPLLSWLLNEILDWWKKGQERSLSSYVLTLGTTKVDKSFHKYCLHTQINSFYIWSMFLLPLSLLFLVNFCPNPSNISGDGETKFVEFLLQILMN
jgi:hypothetical protein